MSNQTTTEDFLLGRMLAFARINEELNDKIKELQFLVDQKSCQENKDLQENFNSLLEKHVDLCRKHNVLMKKSASTKEKPNKIKRGRGRPRKVVTNEQ